MEQYKNYLKDIVALLKEKLERAKQSELAKPKDNFEKGLVMGFYESLDLIKSQAEVFGISLDELGLMDYDLLPFLYSFESTKK